MSSTLVHKDKVTSIDFLSYHNSQAALKNSSRSPAFTPLFCRCAPSYPACGILTKGRSITSVLCPIAVCLLRIPSGALPGSLHQL